jgi:hypothetical protein
MNFKITYSHECVDIHSAHLNPCQLTRHITTSMVASIDRMGTQVSMFSTAVVYTYVFLQNNWVCDQFKGLVAW